MSAVFYQTTNIQFWMSDYLVYINHVDFKSVVMIFSFVCISAPTSGAILSGYIGNKIGGYGSIYALPICIVGSWIVTAASLPICFIENNTIVFVLLWIMFFTGGIIMPLLTGCMLSVVEPENRPQANSLANTMYNLLGFFPAPFIYGFISEYTGGSTSKWGMISTMLVAPPASCFVMLAFYYKLDMKDYWTERKKKIIQQYIETHEGESEKTINNKIECFDENLSRANLKINNYPSILHVEIAESLLPGYGGANASNSDYSDFYSR